MYAPLLELEDRLGLDPSTLVCVGSSPTWGTMKRLVFNYKDSIFVTEASKDNTTIFGSYRIKSPDDMEAILTQIGLECPVEWAINKRTIFSMIQEWRVHNLLYSLGIFKSRTGDVDLNTDQPWYIKVLYFIISPFYLHFK